MLKESHPCCSRRSLLFSGASAVGLAGWPIAFSKAHADSRTDERALRIARVASGLMAPVVSSASVAKTIEERLAEWLIPGVSVAVVSGGRLDWARGWGFTEAGGNQPVTAETLFQAASISKPLFALAMLHLVEQGALALDEDILPFCNGWKPVGFEQFPGAMITLRRLLSHTSGLGNHGYPGYQSGQALPTLRQEIEGIPPAHSDPLRLEEMPGTRFSYSNGGYAAAQLAFETLHPGAFPNTMHRCVLAPLKMNDSTFLQPAQLGLFQRVAKATIAGRTIPGGQDIYPNSGWGGLLSTPSDLAQFMMFVQNTVSGQAHPTLSHNSARMMTTKQFGGWGLGLELEGEGESLIFGHGGVNTGTEALMKGFVQRGDGVIVMANAAGGMRLAAEIIRAVANEYDWPELQPRRINVVELRLLELDVFTGYYESTEESIYLERQGRELFARFRAPYFRRLFHIGHHRFVFEDGDAEIALVLAANAGDVTGIVTADNNQITVRKSEDPLGLVSTDELFLRGTFNDWQAVTGFKRTPAGVLEATIDLAEGLQQFKIADPTWTRFNFGCWPLQQAEIGKALELMVGGENISIRAVSTGTHVFTLDVSRPGRPSLMINPA